MTAILRASWTRLAPRAACVAALLLLIGWWGGALAGLASLTGRTALDTLDIDLRPGGGVDLGWRDLGQIAGARSAESRHIRILQSGDALFLSNVAEAKRLELTYGDAQRAFAESVPIPPGWSAELDLSGASLSISTRRLDARRSALEIVVGARRFSATLARSQKPVWTGAAVRDCRAQDWRDRVKRRLRGLFGDLSIGRLLGDAQARAVDVATFGGAADCMADDVLQIGGIGAGADALPWRAFRLSLEGDTLLLAAFDAGRRRALAFDVRVTPAPGQGPAREVASFEDARWPIGVYRDWGRLTRLIVGSTRYDVVAAEVRPDHSAHVTLRAQAHAPLFAPKACAGDAAARCPHPFDAACPNDPDCLSGPFSARGPTVYRDARDGAALTWTWRTAANPLADARFLEPLLGAKRLAGVRAFLIGLALLLGVVWTMPGLAAGAWLCASAAAAAAAFAALPGGDRPALAVVAAAVAALATALWRLPASPGGGLRLLAVAGACLLALAPEIARAAGGDLAPAATLPFLLADWLLAGVALTACEAGLPLALLWIAVTVLCALGTLNLAEMALDAQTDKFVLLAFKHRLLFLDLAPPLVVAAAVATPAALSRNLEAFAADEAIGLRARWIGVLSLIAALTAALRALPRTLRGRGGLGETGAPERALAARELRGLGFALLRLAAAALLVASMALWLASGSQLGLDEFQPVEFAKFAVIVLTARTLLQILARAGEADLSTRRSVAAILADLACLGGCAVLLGLPAYLAYRRNMDLTSLVFFLPWAAACLGYAALLAWRELFGIAANATILALFIGAMLSVPAAQSDWSPALIMGGVALVMLAAFLVSIGAQAGASAWGRRLARRRTPRPFLAPRRGEWSGFAAWCVLVAALAAAVAGLHLAGRMDALRPFQTIYVAATRIGAWAASAEERLDALERLGLTQGRRVVVERFLALEDMALQDPALGARCAPDPASAEPGGGVRPCYADAEMQLILSRSAVASAPCGLPAEIAPASFPLRELAAGAAWLASAVSPCDQPRPPGAGPAAIMPIEIPVAESDFAGAYLLARLGLGAGLIAFVAQVVFLAVPLHQCAGLFRLGFERGGPRRAAARLLMTVVAGCVCLFAMQWSMSWANVLGLWPVMGQPMTLLSNATSHHVLLVLPALVTFILGVRYARLPTFVYRPRDPPERSRWL